MTTKNKIRWIGAVVGTLCAIELGYLLRDLLMVIGYFAGSLVIAAFSSANLSEEAHMRRILILIVVGWSLVVVLPFALFGAWLANVIVDDPVTKNAPQL
jgi:hypothetical protein